MRLLLVCDGPRHKAGRPAQVCELERGEDGNWYQRTHFTGAGRRGDDQTILGESWGPTPDGASVFEYLIGDELLPGGPYTIGVGAEFAGVPRRRGSVRARFVAPCPLPLCPIEVRSRDDVLFPVLNRWTEMGVSSLSLSLLAGSLGRKR